MNYLKLETEIRFIENKEIRQFTIDVLSTIPNYFYRIPASSGGKYHPNFANEYGGLVKHTIAAVHIALSLFKTGLFGFDNIDKDIIISALLLHDTLKNGNNGSQWTVKSHPQKLIEFLNDRPYLRCPEPYRKEIFNCIIHHMGKWNVKNFPLPTTTKEKFVHLCDYIASRKWISKIILNVFE